MIRIMQLSSANELRAMVFFYVSLHIDHLEFEWRLAQFHDNDETVEHVDALFIHFYSSPSRPRSTVSKIRPYFTA